MPAQAVHGRLVGQAGARRRLIERRHQGLLFQHVHVLAGTGDRLQFPGHVEHVEELIALEILE